VFEDGWIQVEPSARRGLKTTSRGSFTGAGATHRVFDRLVGSSDAIQWIAPLHAGRLATSSAGRPALPITKLKGNMLITIPDDNHQQGTRPRKNLDRISRLEIGLI
jgi:hypothetical protein